MTKTHDDHYCQNTTKCYISCMRMPYAELEYFEVPEPVYMYIRQLENEIVFSTGAVKKLYKDRFTNSPNTQGSNNT